MPRGWGAPPHSALPSSGLREGPRPPGTIWAGKHCWGDTRSPCPGTPPFERLQFVGNPEL